MPREPKHEFTLLSYLYEAPEPTFDDPRFDAIKSSPPAGCIPRDVEGRFGLACRRNAPSLLEAVAGVCGEARDRYGVVLNDLCLEKLWEWSSDGRNGFGATILSQLLLMAAYRGELLGYSTEDLVTFLRTSTGPAGTGA